MSTQPNTAAETPTDQPDPDALLSVIEDHLGPESRDVMEVLLSTHATHQIDGLMAGVGVMVEGPSGCGKTTLLRAFYGLNEQIYRSDDLTPASFVSADSSKTEEELEGIDLLPRLKHRTLVVPDMATWFNGPEEQIRDRYSKFATIMDGDGFTRDSGSQGTRGYTGDYRFNFIGATTPVSPRGHRVMSHVGNRLLFVAMNGEEETDREAIDDLFDGPEYRGTIDACREATHDYLTDLWDYHNGPGGVTWTSKPSEEVRDALHYLAQLIKYARAPLVEGEPQRENIKRVASMLWDLARGHALLYGREEVLMEDLEVCARAALSTMPAERRGTVRALVNPKTPPTLKTAEVARYGDMSPPTAKKRMDTIEDLEIGYTGTTTGRGGETKTLTIGPAFLWPKDLPFPEVSQ